MDPRSATEVPEISDGKVIFVKKYKVVFSILTVISYDLLALAITVEN